MTQQELDKWVAEKQAVLNELLNKEYPEYLRVRQEFMEEYERRKAEVEYERLKAEVTNGEEAGVVRQAGD
jgi:hypothetical protein